MSGQITAEQMLDAFKADEPTHQAETRWAHTHGLGVVGRFLPTDVAANYCIAQHFNKITPVTVRFSNGSSEPVRHDERPDTRGLAVKFHYDDGQDHDLLSMTLNVFGADTRQEFLDVSKAFIPKPVKPESWLKRNILNPLMLRQSPPSLPKGVTSSGGPGLAKYAGTHKFSRAFVIGAGMSQVPVSWARTAYHAVHTFVVKNSEGVQQYVRFSWQPIDGLFPVPVDELASKTTEFLTAEMRQRLAHAPARFTLKMSIGEYGDAFERPSESWPVCRRSIAMGTLYIDKLAENEGVDVEKLSFNPMRLPHGIEASADAILNARGEIYQLGCGERDGVGCPLH